MKRQNLNLAGSLIGTAALLALVLLAGESSAGDLTSASFRLRGGTLSGGGEVGLQSTAGVPVIGSAGVTIGQPGPIGVSTGSTSGITLHAGFWPIVAGGAGVLDWDGDGIPDLLDNCIEVANGPSGGPAGCYTGAQMDTDGDGYGNPCDGDFSHDGAVNSSDVIILNPDLGTGTSTPGTGTDMNCDGTVNSSDVVLFNSQIAQGFPGP